MACLKPKFKINKWCLNTIQEPCMVLPESPCPLCVSFRSVQRLNMKQLMYFDAESWHIYFMADYFPLCSSHSVKLCNLR